MIRKFRYLGIRKQLLLICCILIIAITLTIGIGVFDSASRHMSEMMKLSLLEVTVKNSQLMDARLGQLAQYAVGAVLDKDLNQLLRNSCQVKTNYELYSLDKKISEIIKKYFQFYSDVYSVYIVTSNYVFGNNNDMRDYIPLDTFESSIIYHKANDTPQNLIWIPTYHFADMFNQPFLKNYKFPYSELFSAAKVIPLSSASPQSKIKEPVLLINLSYSFFEDILSGSSQPKNVYYFIITPEGRMVAHSDESLVGSFVKAPWLDILKENSSGYITVNINGENTVVCFEQSKVTGWITATAIQENLITLEIIKDFSKNLIGILISLMLCSFIVFYFATNHITRPIEKLKVAIRQVGHGNFDIHIPEEEASEFRDLIHHFNHMNDMLKRLIHENYETIILKKEAELRALNMQFNPHFLHNTLGLINLKLMEAGQFEASDIIVSLSNMLRYTVTTKENQGLVSLEKELTYTKSYLNIMQSRLGNTFTVCYEIDKDLLPGMVPKFFLQPIVENSIVHGFRERKSGGEIVLNGRIQGQLRIFQVIDNGIGISTDRLKQIQSGNIDSIGLSNVQKRITTIYGDSYGIEIQSTYDQGTVVTINIPRETTLSCD